MALKPVKVPGLDKPLYLPEEIQIHIELISNDNWGSTAISKRQTKTTWHDTGPTGGNADDEYLWAAAGRKGAGPAGYQAIIDDDEIYICHPFDRVTWHAGTTEGNVTSYGAEQCREKVDVQKSIRNAAAFHGAICAAKGWQVDTALVQHHYWYGKPCPSYIRANGLWSEAVKLTTAAAAAARLAAAGQPDQPPVPEYGKPVVIPELDAISKADGIAPASVVGGATTWFWVGDRVKVTTATGRYQRASKQAAKVGPDLTVGEEVDVDWITEYENTLWYYTPWATRIFAGDVVRISDTKGAEKNAEGG